MGKKISYDEVMKHRKYRTLCKLPEDLSEIQIEESQQTIEEPQNREDDLQQTIEEQLRNIEEQLQKSIEEQQNIEEQLQKNIKEPIAKNKSTGGSFLTKIIGTAVLVMALIGVCGFVLSRKTGHGDSDWKDNVLKLTYVENTAEEGSQDSYILDSEIQKQEIQSVTFFDTLDDVPEKFWDVSEEQDGSVLAWIVENGVYYDLYIAAEGGINLKNCYCLFESYTSVEKINFNNCVHTDYTESMGFMFYRCQNLKELDVSGFDVANVTDMKVMFYECQSLTELDVSRFDTANVTDMGFMFSRCLNLTKLDVSGFDTGNVTSMESMFSSCQNLTELDVSNFNTANVANFTYMFYDCQNLKELNLINFNTANVTNFSYMFCDCQNLTQLDLSNFDTGNVTNMEFMFYGCKKLAELDLSSFVITEETNTNYMFEGCESLTVTPKFSGVG